MNTPRKVLCELVAVALLGASTACSGGHDSATPQPFNRVAALDDSSTWMYQLQGLEDPAQVTTLANSDYDLLVVEPGNTFRDEPVDAGQLVHELHAKPGGGNRLVLAYIDIGEAEDYRSYWQDTWQAPTSRPAGVAALPDHR